MAITQERFDEAVSTAYIRGYLAAVELMKEENDKKADEIRQEMFHNKFREFCDTHPNCQSCEYWKQGIDDCLEKYIQDFQKGATNEMSNM